MVRFRKEGAPFGVGSNRFQNLGLHPKFGSGGGSGKLSKVSPASYDPTFPEKPINFLTGWSRSLATEEFSKSLGFSTSAFKERLRSKGNNGPGWHDHLPETKMVKVTFPRDRRFAEKKRTNTPGPGFYASGKKKCTASDRTVPSFERDSFGKRSLDESRPYHLPPNLYKISDFVDELLSKTVSKRGPYDLFTGPRDETSGYGYFRKPSKKIKDVLFNLPSGIDILKSPHNSFKGKFLRCGRDSVPTMRHVIADSSSCKKNPDDPGPGHYDLRSPRKLESVIRHPFGSSLLYARPQLKIEFRPGPGRYYYDKKLKIKGDGMKSSFISKTKRGLPLPDKMSWFE